MIIRALAHGICLFSVGGYSGRDDHGFNYWLRYLCVLRHVSHKIGPDHQSAAASNFSRTTLKGQMKTQNRKLFPLWRVRTTSPAIVMKNTLTSLTPTTLRLPTTPKRIIFRPRPRIGSQASRTHTMTMARFSLIFPLPHLKG